MRLSTLLAVGLAAMFCVLWPGEVRAKRAMLIAASDANVPALTCALREDGWTIDGPTPPDRAEARLARWGAFDPDEPELIVLGTDATTMSEAGDLQILERVEAGAGLLALQGVVSASEAAGLANLRWRFPIHSLAQDVPELERLDVLPGSPAVDSVGEIFCQQGTLGLSGVPDDGATVLVSRPGQPGAAIVATRDVGRGRIAQFELSAAWDDQESLGTVEVLRLYLQLANWAGSAPVAPSVELRATADGCYRPDRDADGIPDASDDCPNTADGLQTDADADGQGDACQFRVTTVPWVPADPRVAHPFVNELPGSFQAVATGCERPLRYRWDFDGDAVYDMVWSEQPTSNYRNLDAQYTYPPQEFDRLFLARVQAACGEPGDEQVLEAEFPVIVRAHPTRAQRVDRAVDLALWWGHLQLSRSATETYLIYRFPMVETATLAQLMMNRGHRAGVDPRTDPYAAEVPDLLFWLVKNFPVDGTQTEVGAAEGVTPDVNGDGTIMYLSFFAGNYESGPVVEALSSFGDPDRLPPLDMSLPMHRMVQPLGTLAQNAAEFHLWSQGETDLGDGVIAGGWHYAPNEPGAIDLSQTGFVTIGLYAAEKNGVMSIPRWVKDRMERSLAWNAMEGERGAYGYVGKDWANVSHAGAALLVLAFVLDGDADDPRVADLLDFIDRHWLDQPLVNMFQLHFGSIYSMFQVTKGMRAFDPPLVMAGAHDWYAEYADWLLGQQFPDGHWQGDPAQLEGNIAIHTLLAAQILLPTLVDPRPVAVAAAEPTLAGPGDVVTFHHEQSYSLDAAAPIVWYRWNFIDDPLDDLDGDGRVSPLERRWEFETADPLARPTFAYRPGPLSPGEEVDYTVALQVEDRLGRTHIDDESIRVRISLVNHPPVALPHPSGDVSRGYQLSPRAGVHLDARLSYDPDEDDPPEPGLPADRIVVFAWDLDGDGTFETDGPEADLASRPGWQIGQSRLVSLRVCDDGQWVGVRDADCPAGDCSLCTVRDVRVEIVANLPPVAAVEPPAPFLREGEILIVEAAPSRDPEGDALTASWTCDPVLPVSPPADPGRLSVDATSLDAPSEDLVGGCTLTVTDPEGATASLDFPVRIANAAPIIDSIEVPSTATVGEAFTVSVVAHDPAAADDPTLTYGVDCDGDDRLDVVDSLSGVMTCTAASPGPRTVRVVVSDDDGGLASASSEPVDIAGPATGDLDEDGLDDAWEALHGVGDPRADEDADGIQNREEQTYGTDPRRFDGPSAPELRHPVDAIAVATQTPVLVVGNATDGNPRGARLRYLYRISREPDLAHPVAVSPAIDEAMEGTDETAWAVPDGVLEENVVYYWTASARNAVIEGPTAPPESFVVSTGEEAPTAPAIHSPQRDEVLTPGDVVLGVDNASDPDPGDTETLRLECELAADRDFAEVVARGETPQDASGSTNVPLAPAPGEGVWHARCQAIDRGGLRGPWSKTISFAMRSSGPGSNSPPGAPEIVRPAHLAIVGELEGARITVIDAVDPEGDPLTYRFELSTRADFAEEATLVSDEVQAGAGAVAGETTWDVPDPLQDNTGYVLRVRARDTMRSGITVSGRFRTDVVNEPPTVPMPLRPLSSAETSGRPTFEFTAAQDPEAQPVTYEIAVRRGPEEPPFYSAETDDTRLGHDGPTALPPGAWQWQVRARDEQGLRSGWSEPASFRVADGTQSPNEDAGPDGSADAFDGGTVDDRRRRLDYTGTNLRDGCDCRAAGRGAAPWQALTLGLLVTRLGLRRRGRR